MSDATPETDAVVIPGRRLVYQHTRPVYDGVPPPILALVCLACFPVGFLVLFAAILAEEFVQSRRRARWRRGRETRPDAPWTWDHPWNPAGEVRSQRRPGAITACGGAVLVGAASLLAQSLIEAGGVGWTLLAPGAVAACGFAYMWIGWRRIARGALHLSRPFPCFVGDSVEMSLAISEDGATFETITLELRRVEERPKWPFVGRTWSLKVTAPADARLGPDADLPFAFDVPADARGTRLDGPYACAWELVVRAKTDRGPLEETFLVPIYARPASSALP